LDALLLGKASVAIPWIRRYQQGLNNVLKYVIDEYLISPVSTLATFPESDRTYYAWQQRGENSEKGFSLKPAY
jgi:hypothetical protein